MPQQTTSAVAGAVWAPPRPAERAAQTLGWTEHSLRVFRDLADDPATGVRMAPALAVGQFMGAEAASPAAKLIPDLRPADPADVPPGFGTGFRATMPMIDMPQYLDYLTGRLAAAGGEIEARPVRSLAKAADTAPIVVNCAGLGAGALCGLPAYILAAQVVNGMGLRRGVYAFIAGGLLSRYQLWFALAIGAQVSAFILNRWVASRKTSPALALVDEDLTMLTPDLPKAA